MSWKDGISTNEEAFIAAFSPEDGFLCYLLRIEWLMLPRCPFPALGRERDLLDPPLQFTLKDTPQARQASEPWPVPTTPRRRRSYLEGP